LKSQSRCVMCSKMQQNRLLISICFAFLRALASGSCRLNAESMNAESMSWLLIMEYSPRSSTKLPMIGSGGHGKFRSAMARAWRKGSIVYWLVILQM